jgi:hypothetical protein
MRRIFFLLCVLGCFFPAAASARSREEAVRGAEGEKLFLPAVDLAAATRLDERTVSAGGVPAFAVPLEVDVDPWRYGRWRRSDPQTLHWLLPISSPGARSLSLAFDKLELPPGSRLLFASPDGRRRLEAVLPEQLGERKSLWTAPLTGEEMAIELYLPLAGLDKLELHLSRVHHGYAGFGQPLEEKIGGCHRDLACAEAEEWRGAGRSVGLLTVDGIRFCTGFLVNNTALDRRPLLLTAGHCGITPRSAASVVLMWDYRRSACGGDAATEPGRIFQSGARFLAHHEATDIVLLELDRAPDAEARVQWAGWDRGEEEAFSRTASVHHPGTDAQRLALDVESPRRTQYLEDAENAAGAYWRVSWELGSTEGGSSGAPLFDADQHAIGVLRGGLAACSARREPDWFGRLAAAWEGRGPAQRLRDWLDPAGTGVTKLDRLLPKKYAR